MHSVQGHQLKRNKVNWSIREHSNVVGFGLPTLYANLNHMTLFRQPHWLAPVAELKLNNMIHVLLSKVNYKRVI